MSPLLLCTDLDRTLLPNGEQPESPSARTRFGALAGREATTLVFVTGRDQALVRAAMDEYALPRPGWVIGDVGTTITEVRPDGTWQPWTEWAEHIDRDWNGQDGSELAGLLAGVPGLRLQEAHKQNRHKLSFYTPLGTDPAALQAQVVERLQAAGLNARVIWSVDEAAGVGLLDVLPASASKLHAIRALMSKLDMTLEQVVFCGDSGNDFEVLVSEIPAVLVANAMPEVREQAAALAAENGNAAMLYLAHGGFLGMNGHYAAGILEGVAHYRPDLQAWMQAIWETAA